MYRPSSSSTYRVAMTSSTPSRSANGATMSWGVVVASTTGRPSRWCSAISGRAYGATISARDSAAFSAASCTDDRSQPRARLAACLARAMPTSDSPTSS